MSTKALAYLNAYNNFLVALMSGSQWDAPIAYSTLFQAARSWSQEIIDKKEIPPRDAKAVEMATRLWSRERRPKDLQKWFDQNSRRLELLAEAKSWPDRTVGEGNDASAFLLGSFTVHNTLHASGKQLEKAKDAIKKATQAARTVDLPGFGSMLRGDLYLVGQLGRKNWGAWYMKDKDTIYVRPNVRGLPESEVSRHIVHELAHRYWAKNLDADFKRRWTRYHNNLRRNVNSPSAPKEGETVPFEVNGKKGVTVSYKEKPGKVVLKDSEGTAIGATEIRTLIKWMRDSAEMGAYPTPYASTDPEEHFAEVVSLLGFGDLDDASEGALRSIMSGEDPGAPSAQRVARRFASLCRKKTSLGWIDPKGRFYPVSSGIHESWALDYLRRSEPGLVPTDEWALMSFDATEALFARGWVRLINYRMSEFKGRTPYKALQTMANTLIDCIVELRQEPHRVEVSLWNGTREDRFSADKFVSMYGDEEALDRMYEALLEIA